MRMRGMGIFWGMVLAGMVAGVPLKIAYACCGACPEALKSKETGGAEATKSEVKGGATPKGSEDAGRGKRTPKGVVPECPDLAGRVGRHQTDLKDLKSEADAKLTGVSRDYGSAGETFRGSGAASGNYRAGSGMRNLGRGAGFMARQFEQLASQITQEQKSIANESITQNPGPGHPEAQEFFNRTNGGKNPYSNYSEEATHPMVKQQAAAYDTLGNSRLDAEDSAKKFRDQEKEFNRLAEKENKNGKDLGAPEKSNEGNIVPSSQASAGSAEPTPGIAEAKSLRASGTSLKIGASAADASGSSDAKISSAAKDQSDIAAKKDTASQAAYPDGAAGANSKGASSPYDSLREKLLNAKGRKGGTGEEAEDKGGATASADGKKGEAVAGGAAADANAKAASKELKEEDLTNFEKGLGGPKLALSGSETDDSVKKMISALSGEDEKGASRNLASENDGSIGTQDGPTLFERAHATHNRCARSGCVNTAKQRMGG